MRPGRLYGELADSARARGGGDHEIAVIADFYASLRERQLQMGLRAVTTTTDRIESVLAEHSAIVQSLHAGDLVAIGNDRHAPRIHEARDPRSLRPEGHP